MEPAGAVVRVRDVEVGRGQVAVHRAGVRRGVHDRRAVHAVAQAQSVAQFVSDHGLEIVLTGANLRGIAAGVEIPTGDDGDLPAVGGAAERTGLSASSKLWPPRSRREMLTEPCGLCSAPRATSALGASGGSIAVQNPKLAGSSMDF
jgi:hypothetical protein